MTLLHQAAQKAVEAPEYKPAGAPMEVWNSPFYDLQTRLEICAGAVAFEREVSANMRRQRDEARAALSALQQQPEPADSLLASHLAYTRAHLPALQQQEVPREPVALTDKQIQDAVFAVLRKWNTDRAWERYTRESGPYDVSSLRPEVLEIIRAVLAASPSTTRQQEVGSRKQLTEEQIILATEHISMERPGVFVYVARAIERAHGIGVAAAPSTPENAGGVEGRKP